jgi:hypothetical protein
MMRKDIILGVLILFFFLVCWIFKGEISNFSIEPTISSPPPEPPKDKEEKQIIQNSIRFVKINDKIQVSKDNKYDYKIMIPEYFPLLKVETTDDTTKTSKGNLIRYFWIKNDMPLTANYYWRIRADFWRGGVEYHLASTWDKVTSKNPLDVKITSPAEDSPTVCPLQVEWTGPKGMNLNYRVDFKYFVGNVSYSYFNYPFPLRAQKYYSGKYSFTVPPATDTSLCNKIGNAEKFFIYLFYTYEGNEYYTRRSVIKNGCTNNENTDKNK